MGFFYNENIMLTTREAFSKEVNLALGKEFKIAFEKLDEDIVIYSDIWIIIWIKVKQWGTLNAQVY